MGTASGFLWVVRKGSGVEISHHGKRATTLRGDRAAEFLADMAVFSDQEQQEEMARLTGNYRRGNERLAKTHPRNR